MTRAAEATRLAELRALGPTLEDHAGPSSIRPATLEQCWRVIELLDREALHEGSAHGALSRLIAELRRWQAMTAVPLVRQLLTEFLARYAP